MRKCQHLSLCPQQRETSRSSRENNEESHSRQVIATAAVSTVPQPHGGGLEPWTHTPQRQASKVSAVPTSHEPASSTTIILLSRLTRRPQSSGDENDRKINDIDDNRNDPNDDSCLNSILTRTTLQRNLTILPPNNPPDQTRPDQPTPPHPTQMLAPAPQRHAPAPAPPPPPPPPPPPNPTTTAPPTRPSPSPPPPFSPPPPYAPAMPTFTSTSTAQAHPLPLAAAAVVQLCRYGPAPLVMQTRRAYVPEGLDRFLVHGGRMRFVARRWSGVEEVDEDEEDEEGEGEEGEEGESDDGGGTVWFDAVEELDGGGDGAGTGTETGMLDDEDGGARRWRCWCGTSVHGGGGDEEVRRSGLSVGEELAGGEGCVRRAVVWRLETEAGGGEEDGDQEAEEEAESDMESDVAEWGSCDGSDDSSKRMFGNR
ncbi:uncharacterized protein BKCO1_1000484 [Diplodia corticola]|uniref:Uncharacterized protein n=1 Tax=Diplodia corticola TaxID=236234 RepID=A0A1J9S6S0_9PEZI|nr:uncharacterized protein BKCO1_1000484 [Diplodia corticola]OJD40643.1 hypothetical protein BKCO1_1000484 [Diplodia corticola]